MRRVLFLLLAGALTAGAQSQQPSASRSSTNLNERAQAPSYSDIHCAGFLRERSIPRTNYISAGLQSPNATQYGQGDTVFIDGGGLQEGTLLNVVRELQDPNRNEAFSGQRAAISSIGAAYADVGRLRVIAIRGQTAIARVEFSCAPVVPGDLTVAYEERTTTALRRNVPFDRFPNSSSGPTGQILMARDFDTVLGTGHKIYLDLGSEQGVKAGDYFRIVRFYDPDQMPPVDRLSFTAPASENALSPRVRVKKQEYKNLPRRAVGQAVVLMSNPGSATAMITFATEEIVVGDQVELEPSPAANLR